MLNTYQVAPSHKGHISLEKRITTFLKSKGFVIETKNTYHDSFSKETIDLLKNRHTPTSLAVRGRADKLAVHKTLPIEFFYDAKTHVSPEYHDLTVEAIPLAHHIQDSYAGVRTLYMFVDASGQDRSFRAIGGLRIREIHIPNRWNATTTAWFQNTLSLFLPGVPIRTGTKSKGSGDPYAIIDRSVVSKMIDWQSAVERLIAEGR